MTGKIKNLFGIPVVVKIKSNCRIAEKKEEENVRRMFVRYRRNDANSQKMADIFNVQI